MRRSSRRSGVVPAPSAPAPVAKTKEKVDKVDALFAHFADKHDMKLIGPEGIEALCDDLGFEPTDFKILLLAWKLEASKQGFFTEEEWRKGLKTLRADSTAKLRKALCSLEEDIFQQDEEFKQLYTFAFQYCLTEPRQKTLELDSACEMLQLVMEDRPHLENFIQFLKEQKEYKGINLDQWTGFLRFCDEVEPDMSNYDESQAWPLLMDNYVEWWKQRGNLS